MVFIFFSFSVSFKRIGGKKRMHCQLYFSRTCRGVATWSDNTKIDGDECRKRVFMATTSGLLVSIDAATGKLCLEFGENVNIFRRKKTIYNFALKDLSN